MLNARDKMTIIANRQNALTKLCASYIMGVQDMLKVPRSSMVSIINMKVIQSLNWQQLALFYHLQTHH